MGQQLPPYTVTRVDSVSRPPPPSSALSQMLGPELSALLCACNHSYLGWRVGRRPARNNKTRLKKNS